MEIQSKKNDHKMKDLTNEKMEWEQKTQFNKDRIETLESELKKCKNELKELKLDENRQEGGALLPESVKANMRERIKQLEKENTILKQEIENRFDKDKAIISNKL